MSARSWSLTGMITVPSWAMCVVVPLSAISNLLLVGCTSCRSAIRYNGMMNVRDHDRERWLALYVLCAGVLMIVLDGTIVNVALPTIQRELAFSQATLAWVINAYLIAFGGLLLLAGRLGDLTSRRGVFVGGLAVFTTASLACGLAQDQTMLVAARFVQGAGGAATSAVGLGMIVTMFPKPHEQAKAIGVYAFVASAGGSIGLLAGGVITQALDWHWTLRERADRDRHGGARAAADRAGQRHRLP